MFIVGYYMSICSPTSSIRQLAKVRLSGIVKFILILKWQRAAVVD